MARRPSQSREFVRLTPFQFSVSVSVVVILLAGAGAGGYLYGLKKGVEKPEQVSMDDRETIPVPDPKPARLETSAPVTFYTVLTEPRKEETAPVQVKKPAEVKSPEVTTPTSRSGDLSLILQVASYRDRQTAANLLQNLSAEGYSGDIETAELGERGTWYRVRIGPYGSEAEADRILERLRNERDLKGFIVR